MYVYGCPVHKMLPTRLGPTKKKKIARKKSQLQIGLFCIKILD
jgi:hypothetical protein